MKIIIILLSLLSVSNLKSQIYAYNKSLEGKYFEISSESCNEYNDSFYEKHLIITNLDSEKYFLEIKFFGCNEEESPYFVPQPNSIDEEWYQSTIYSSVYYVSSDLDENFRHSAYNKDGLLAFKLNFVNTPIRHDNFTLNIYKEYRQEYNESGEYEEGNRLEEETIRYKFEKTIDTLLLTKLGVYAFDKNVKDQFFSEIKRYNLDNSSYSSSNSEGSGTTEYKKEFKNMNNSNQRIRVYDFNELLEGEENSKFSWSEAIVFEYKNERPIKIGYLHILKNDIIFYTLDGLSTYLNKNQIKVIDYDEFMFNGNIFKLIQEEQNGG